MNEPSKKKEQQPLMDKAQVAFFLGVTQRTVENLMRDRRIPFLKVGNRCRFDSDQVKAAFTVVG